jgi:hypothetical protein
MIDNRPILFLDIDGVLLVRRWSGMFDAYELAPHCLEFLEFATARFQCRWLSTRCRHGFLDGSCRAFRSAGAPLDDPRWAVLDLIKPAVWATSKVEAIDPKTAFWWVDDAPTEAERDWLRQHRCEKRLVEIDLERDANTLIRARALLTATLDADRCVGGG